jgi:hypothetical protein
MKYTVPMVLFVMFQTCRRIEFEDRAQRLRVTPGGQEQGRRRAGVCCEE